MENEQTVSYCRNFELGGGPLVLGISLVSAIILAMIGAFLSTVSGSAIYFIICTFLAASFILTGYVISKFLNIQNAKLELMEIQTELMLKRKT